MYENEEKKFYDENGEERIPTIGEIEDWGGSDGWGHVPTIGEIENW